MVTGTSTDYRRRIQANAGYATGIYRNLKKDPDQLRSARIETAVNNVRNNTASNPLLKLNQGSQVSILTTRGARKLNETMVSLRKGVETYKRNNDLFRQSIQQSAELYRRTNSSLQQGITVLHAATEQNASSGLFSLTTPNLPGLVLQGIQQYQLIDKPSGGTSELLSSSARLYLKTGTKLFQESQLFRQF